MRTRPIPTAAILSLGLLVARAPAADEPKGDLAKIQGSWTAKIGPDKDIPITVTIKGNAVDLVGTTPNGDDFKLKGEIKLDEKASPKTLDWAKFTGPQGNEIPENLGIYKLDGDNWTVCSGGPGNERPAKFEAGEGGPPSLTTWTRVKPKDAPAEKKPPEGDLARFQGSWTGLQIPDKGIPISMTITGNAVEVVTAVIVGQELRLKGEIKIDEKVSPKQFDWVGLTGPGFAKLPANPAIYMLDGDSLTLCLGGPNEERPTKLEAGAGGLPMLIVWTRVKAAEKPPEGDLARFQGSWAGKDEDSGVAINLEIKENAVTARWTGGDGANVEIKGELRLNDQARPRTVDFFGFKHASGEKMNDILGLYEIDGATIKMCTGGPGDERPTDLKPGRGGPPILRVFARKKG